MRNALTPDEKIMFFKRLALFLHAGISIRHAFMLLRDDARSASSKSFFDSLIDDLMHGRSLTTALQRFPRSFTPFHVNLIAVGERSGTLTNSLSQLAGILKQRSDMRKKLIGTAVYPVIIGVGTLGITLFLVLYAFPKIVPILLGFHAALPFPTRVLIGISNLVARHGLLMLLAVLANTCCIAYAFRMRPVREGTQKIMLLIPYIGNTMRYFSITTISRTLATLLESGIAIEPAFSMTHEGVSHPSYRDSLDRIRVAIGQGNTLSTQFACEPSLYPTAVVQLIAAGEMTGTLVASLRQVAAVYEEELEERLQRMGALIEPMLMIGMGLVVGFVAMAIITPIYGLTQNLSMH